MGTERVQFGHDTLLASILKLLVLSGVPTKIPDDYINNARLFILVWGWIKLKKPGKNVLLLMDNHSAPVSAVEALKEEESPIFNIIEIPPNTTSRYQPCD